MPKRKHLCQVCLECIGLYGHNSIFKATLLFNVLKKKKEMNNQFLR